MRWNCRHGNARHAHHHVQVGSVGTDPGDEIAPKTKLTNTVNASADPVGGGSPVTSTASRAIVVLGATDDPFPGNASMNKTASGPLNISATTTANFSGTYPGRWLPAGDNTGQAASVTAAAPASYTLTSRADNNGLQYAIVDPVPCLTAHSGVTYRRCRRAARRAPLPRSTCWA